MTLTAKQKQVADLVANDLENRQVAEKLGSTQGAIEQHLVKIYRRLGINNRAQLKEIIGQVKVSDGRKKSVEVAL